MNDEAIRRKQVQPGLLSCFQMQKIRIAKPCNSAIIIAELQGFWLKYKPFLQLASQKR
jgi:hypothetical protein